MNKGQRPDIQPFCKSIECFGRKPIKQLLIINDQIMISMTCQKGYPLPSLPAAGGRTTNIRASLRTQ
jgi:hypothetical protein